MQKEAERDVALAAGPWEVIGSHAVCFTEDCVTNRIKRLGRDAADCGDPIDIRLDESHIDVAASGEDDEVGAVAGLWLSPCGIGQLLFEIGRGDNEKLPGLQPIAAGGEDEGLFEGFPVVGRNSAGGVEEFGGAAPEECGSDGGHWGQGHGGEWMWDKGW